MRLASAAFVLLLLDAHAANDSLGQPLSLFRDGEQPWLGYLLFGALLLVGLFYTRDLIRAGVGGEAVTAGLATLLLFIIAVTPSLSSALHGLSTLLLLLLLFGYYWWLLRDSGGPWLIFHWLAPFAFLFLTRYHSYGLWQKCMILYLVALANVRLYFLDNGRADGPSPTTAPRSCGGGRGGVRKRRKVYRLEAGREWARMDGTGR